MTSAALAARESWMNSCINALHAPLPRTSGRTYIAQRVGMGKCSLARAVYVMYPTTCRKHAAGQQGQLATYTLHAHVSVSALAAGAGPGAEVFAAAAASIRSCCLPTACYTIMAAYSKAAAPAAVSADGIGRGAHWATQVAQQGHAFRHPVASRASLAC